MKYIVASGGFLFCAGAVVILIGIVALAIAIMTLMNGGVISDRFWPVAWFIAIAAAIPSGFIRIGLTFATMIQNRMPRRIFLTNTALEPTPLPLHFWIEL